MQARLDLTINLLVTFRLLDMSCKHSHIIQKFETISENLVLLTRCGISETASFFETQKQGSSEPSNGQNHQTEEMDNQVIMDDKNIKAPEVNMETQTLPDGIKIIETILMGVSHYGVFCSGGVIKKGKRFGPFTGRNIPPQDIFKLSDTSYTWEVSIIKMC